MGRRDSLAADESPRVLGDIVLVNDHPLMLQGSDKNALITIDVEDKVTALSEEDTDINRIALITRTTKNMIGEFSNYASVYLNRLPQREEQKKRYEDFGSVISVIVGKSMSASRGVRWQRLMENPVNRHMPGVALTSG